MALSRVNRQIPVCQGVEQSGKSEFVEVMSNEKSYYYDDCGVCIRYLAI